MKRTTGVSALSLICLPLMPLGHDAVATPEGDRFTITVENRALRAVKVWTVHYGTGTRPGTVRPGATAPLRARCADFLASSTDVILRELPGRPFRLKGVGIVDCGQEIKIDVPPIGVEFSRIWIQPRGRRSEADGPGQDGSPSRG